MSAVDQHALPESAASFIAFSALVACASSPPTPQTPTTVSIAPPSGTPVVLAEPGEQLSNPFDATNGQRLPRRTLASRHWSPNGESFEATPFRHPVSKLQKSTDTGADLKPKQTPS